MKNIKKRTMIEEQDYDKINIIVGGKAAVGKSTVIYVIKEALKKAGLDVEFDGGLDFDDEEDFDEKMKPYIKTRIFSIDCPIKIKEVQFALKLNKNE